VFVVADIRILRCPVRTPRANAQQGPGGDEPQPAQRAMALL
jgi:hypothetical protein